MKKKGLEFGHTSIRNFFLFNFQVKRQSQTNCLDTAFHINQNFFLTYLFVSVRTNTRFAPIVQHIFRTWSSASKLCRATTIHIFELYVYASCYGSDVQSNVRHFLSVDSYIAIPTNQIWRSQQRLMLFACYVTKNALYRMRMHSSWQYYG